MRRINPITLIGRALLIAPLWFGGCGGEETDHRDAVIPLAAAMSVWSPVGAQGESHWTVGAASLDPADPKQFHVAPGGAMLVNTDAGGQDLATKQHFGDALYEMQFILPENSNSGVLLMGRYEVQVENDPQVDPADPGPLSMGAVAWTAAPLKYIRVEPGQPCTLAIRFRAPQFGDEGRKTANARIEAVHLNGQVVQRDVELDDMTTAVHFEAEAAQGPLVLQGAEGPIAYYAIRVTPLPED